MNINIFENAKASRTFSNISESLTAGEKIRFVGLVKDLFDEKSVAEEGEFDSFKVSEQELLDLASKFAVARVSAKKTTHDR